MKEYAIYCDLKTSINSMLKAIEKELCADEEVRVYFLTNEEVFKFFRSRLRSSLKGVAIVHTSPRKFICNSRFYGLDFYPDNSLRNEKISEVLAGFRQL